MQWGEDVDSDPDDASDDDHGQIVPIDDDQRLFEGYLYTSANHTLGADVSGLAGHFARYDVYVYIDADDGKSSTSESVR